VNSTGLYVVSLVWSDGFTLLAGLELDSILVVSMTELVTGELVD
jgi:hypothetical protein